MREVRPEPHRPPAPERQGQQRDAVERNATAPLALLRVLRLLEGELVSKSIDLSLELPGTSFIAGSTIEATVRATAEGEVMAEGGRVELVRTMSYRYTAWSPYASPFTVPSRDTKVISQAHFSPAGPLVEGRPFVRPVILDIPPMGRARSMRNWSTSAGWCMRACTSPGCGTPR
jgi:hypothetical protein